MWSWRGKSEVGKSRCLHSFTDSFNKNWPVLSWGPQKKDTKITDTVAFYLGFVDCHLKNPGTLHTHFRRPIPHLALCLGLWNHRFAWSHAWFSSLMSSRPNVMEVRKSQKKCHKKIVSVSNPLNCSWWFPLIFPPSFPKSSLRILKGSPVIGGSGSFHSLSQNLACTGSKKTATYRASQLSQSSEGTERW